ncbi:MAG: hypothetical protein KatS3mg065_0884 [Chloroflexota bacterium]|nr:MAG: hypothetical protein KatS3mg065_0884 [Chloroflexota bacterium]
MTEPQPSLTEPFAGRRVLVTGGAGFVGGAVVRRLVEADAQVTVLDDLFTGRAETLPPDIRFVEGSVVDEVLVGRLVAEADYVFHLAARNIIASTKNPRDDFATNIGGTLNVLLAARSAGVRRVVYTGSTSVYGNPRSIPINEDDAIVPLSPYAVSKLAGEHYCIAFYESYGLPVCRRPLLERLRDRPAPRQPVLRRGRQVLRCRSRRPAAPDPRRRPADPRLHVHRRRRRGDAPGGHRTRGPKGEVFNVGTGIETTINDLARMVGEAVERPRRGRPRRPPGHRQHPAPGRLHREGPPDAALVASGHPRRGATTNGGLDAGTSRGKAARPGPGAERSGGDPLVI